MAKDLQICRICLSNDTIMITLKNTNIANLYNLLTQVHIDIGDGKPTTACFECYTKLRECDRLQQQAMKSNELLEQLLKEGVMVLTTNHTDSEPANDENLLIDPKVEVDVKEEARDEECNVTDSEPANGENLLIDPKVEVDVKEEAGDEECNLTDFYEDPNDSYDFEASHSDSEDDQPLIALGSNKCDGIKDISYGINWTNRQKEENLCTPEKEVKYYPDPNDETSNNQEKAKGIHIKSKRYVEKKRNTFVTKKQNFQKPINNDKHEEVDVKSKRKFKKTKTNLVSNERIFQITRQKEDTKKEDLNGEEFQCNECGKKCSTKDILIGHILKCMKIRETSVRDSQVKKADTLKSLLSGIYSCDICTFKTNQIRCIENHLKMHTVTKVLHCSICDYRGTHKHHLKDHMRTHTGEKPFSCNICEYRCAQRTHLKLHLRTHSGEKPFPCNICEYRCASKLGLKSHMRNHTGEKPFSCKVCEYRCASKSNLNTHIRIHTGEKPFSCNICKYKFARTSNLKKHLRTHH